jgi:predicted nucleic acid-binding protein
MRLPCIVDASVLIDLSKGGILPLLFELPIQSFAPDLVLDEMIQPDRISLLNLGLKHAEMTPDQLIEAMRMQVADGQLSVGDCAALITARDLYMALLTGDRRLRKRAEDADVPVHGVLWLLDQVEEAGLLSGPELADVLRTILLEGARLPVSECEMRFKRWEPPQ